MLEISADDAFAAGDEFTTKTTNNINNNNILTGSWKKFPNHTYTTPDNKNKRYCSTPKSNISKKRCYPSPLDKIRCENYRRRIVDFGLKTCTEKSFELNQSFPRVKRKRNNINNNNYYESTALTRPDVKPVKIKYDNNKQRGMDKIRVDGAHGLRFTARRKGGFTPGNHSPFSGGSIVNSTGTNTTTTTSTSTSAAAAAASTAGATPTQSTSTSAAINNKESAVVRIPKNGINPHKAVFIIDSETSKILIVNNNACQLLGYTSKELCDLQFSSLLTCKHKNRHASALAEVQMNSEDGTMVLLSGKVVEMNTIWNTKIAVSLWIRQIDIAGRCLAVAEPVERIVAQIVIDKNGLISSCDYDTLMLFQIESQDHICGNQIQTLIPAIQLPDPDNSMPIVKQIRKQKATGKTADNLTFPLCLMINHQESITIMDSNNDSGVSNSCGVGGSGSGSGSCCCNHSNNIDHSYVITIWVYQNISGLMVIDEMGTIESCNHHFSMIMFGYSQSKILDRPITDVIPNFGQAFEYVDYPPAMGGVAHSRNGTSSSLIDDSNNINNTDNNQNNNNDININNKNINMDDDSEETSETDPNMFNIDCRVACNFSYDGKCCSGENKIHFLKNITGHPEDNHFIWKTNSEPDKLASAASASSSPPSSKQKNNYGGNAAWLAAAYNIEKGDNHFPMYKENMFNHNNNNNNNNHLLKSMSDNSLIVDNYENNKNLANVNYNKCNNSKCTNAPYVDNLLQFNLDEHFIVQDGTLLIKNQNPSNSYANALKSPTTSIVNNDCTNEFNDGAPGDIEQLTPVNETDISEYLLRNSLSNNNTCTNIHIHNTNNTIELEKLNLLHLYDDKSDFSSENANVKTPTIKSSEFSSIAQHQTTKQSDIQTDDNKSSKATDNFILQRRTSHAISLLPTSPSSTTTTTTNNQQQQQLNQYNDGKYKGEAIHHDGNILDILYTISSHILPCGRKVFCVWICRDPDVDGDHDDDDCDADDDDEDRYLQDDDEKHQNLTLTFNSMTSTVENSLGQIIKSSAAATASSSAAAAAAAAGAGIIPNSSRPNSVSLLSQCEDDQINGEYSKYYTTLKQIGKGAYGYVKMGYRNSDRLLIITKFILKCKLSPQFMVQTDDKREIPMEIYLLTTVKHPNIVAVFDVFENEKFFQMIMERHGSGMDLFEFIDRCRMVWMDEKLGCFIFRQIANAIDYLHTLNILHRDIKDENIIIDQHFHVKLIDFGSATFMEDGKLFSTFYGTTEYCSPEVLAGNKYAGPELEMWSLGVTLYVLMFFENPFLDIEETLHEELAIPQNISLPLENVLFAMLDKNPKTRCTMKELLQCEWITQEINPSVFNFALIVSCDAHESNPEKYYSGHVYSHTTTGHSTTSPQDSLALADDEVDDGDPDEDSMIDAVDTNELDDGVITENLDVIVNELGDADADDGEDEDDDDDDDDDDKSQPSQSGCEKYNKLTTGETVQIIDISANNSETLFKGKQYLPIPNQKSLLKVSNDSATIPSSLLSSSSSTSTSTSSSTSSAATSITNNNNDNINNTSDTHVVPPIEHPIETACHSGYSTTTVDVFNKQHINDTNIKSPEEFYKTSNRNIVDNKLNPIMLRKTTMRKTLTRPTTKNTNAKTTNNNNNNNNGKINLMETNIYEKVEYNNYGHNNNNNSDKNPNRYADEHDDDGDDEEDEEYDENDFNDEEDDDDDAEEDQADDDLDKESYL